jgi:hypothetical protein
MNIQKDSYQQKERKIYERIMRSIREIPKIDNFMGVVENE